MGKLERFRINLLNNTNDVYLVGQKVHGFLKFKLKETMEVHQIWLIVDGRSKTSWIEHEGNVFSRNRETKDFSASEAHLGCQILLWPCRNNLPSTSQFEAEFLQPGHYAFPFTFVIPNHCPSSFEANYGNIRYTCKAVINRPRCLDIKYKYPFTVIGSVDLNSTETDALTPIQNHVLKKVGFSCLLTGNVECKVNVERRGFVPGENVPLYLSLANNSSFDIVKIKEKLVQIAEFTSKFNRTQQTKTHSRVLVKMQQDIDVKSGRCSDWCNNALRIPPVPPTLKSQGIITVRYELHIKIITNRLASNHLQLTYPIIIGSSPLRVEKHNNDILQNGSGSAAQNGSGAADGPPNHSHEENGIVMNGTSNQQKSKKTQTPTYEECIFGPVNIREPEDDENTTGPSSYVPRYPYYCEKSLLAASTHFEHQTQQQNGHV